MKYYDLNYVSQMEAGWGGFARRWKIYILESLKADKGILEHEKFHVRQWWFTLGFHSFLYRQFDWYKLWSEIKAYKVQLKYSPKNAKLFAYFIATRYGLDISIAEAHDRLIDG